MIKVFAAIPVHRVWQRDSFNAFSAAVEASKYCKVSTVFNVYEESLIQRARNNCLEAFLKSNADFLFFLDDDVVLFQKNSIDQLVSHEADIVSAPVVTKRAPFLPNFFPFENEYPDFRKIGDGLFPVRYVATACVMISRRVCERVRDNHKYPFDCYETFIDGNKGDVYLSEDWAFCDRANKMGFKCFVDPKIVVGHLGQYPYSMNDYYTMKGHVDNDEKRIY